MKNNIRALKETSQTMLGDRICSNSGLVRLIKSEIVQALSPYIEIDTSTSFVNVEIAENGVKIECNIHAYSVKRFGLNV